jgi:capsular polysaccharide biosynthesis protein
LARTDEGSFIEVYAEHTVERKPPVTAALTIHPEFERQLSVRAAGAGVAVLRVGRIVGPHGNVVSSHDELVGDVSPEFRTPWYDTAIARRLRLPPLETLEGPLGVVGAWATWNYFHWLFDVLPRFHLLERSEISMSSVVVTSRMTFQEQSLELMRLPWTLIPLEADPHLEAAPLIVPALSVRPRTFPPWACQFLRDTFLPVATPAPSGNSRLFISRRTGGRVILNEEEVLIHLEQAGFSVIRLDDLPFPHQVSAFATAEIVVAAHGAGLANIVFCTPGTRIVEIFDPTYVVVDYWSLANQVGLPYRYLLGEDRKAGRDGRLADIVVDAAALMSTVEDALR